MEKPAPTAPPPMATDKAATFALMALVLVAVIERLAILTTELPSIDALALVRITFEDSAPAALKLMPPNEPKPAASVAAFEVTWVTAVSPTAMVTPPAVTGVQLVVSVA